MYTFINCPKCGKENKIDISNSIDELGEVFMCPRCGWKYRYVEK